MKKVADLLLYLWSAITCFISPIWLTLVFVNITGQIYQYDYSMDEGTAGIFGISLSLLWVVFALIPNIVLMRKLYKRDKKFVLFDVIGMIVLCIICIAMCDWNVIAYLF